MGFKPIQWNRGRSHRNNSEESHSRKKCSQCDDEPAVGTVQMADGKWRRVGRKCKRAMRVGHGGQIPRSDTAQAPRHASNNTGTYSGFGNHRTGTRRRS